MAAPVWVLSVDLQTKTATFTSGMAEAAKSARGAFTDIKAGASEMGRETGFSMTEARHGVMLFAEGFDTHLPRALSTFIASIGPIGAAMEAAFPFLAIAFGAKLLIEHLVKIREEGEKLTEDQTKFGTAVNNAFNALHTKLLEAGIKADELNKNHLGALKKQLELIDLQSMDELVRSFDLISKASDAVFKDLKSHWYTEGIGAEGAKHALEQFKTQYDALLTKGDSKGAHDLLAGTLDSAEKVLQFQKEYIGNQLNANTNKGGDGRANPDYLKFEEAALALKQAGVGTTKDEVTAQQQLVDALTAQVRLAGEGAELKKKQSDNAKQHAGNEVRDDEYKALKLQLEMEKSAQEQEDREREEARSTAIAQLQEGEREKIEATRKGSAERLQAIDAAIREEETKGLQETSFYHSLQVQRVATVRDMAAEEMRIREEAGREAAAHANKMAELEIAAEREKAQLLNSVRHITAQEQAEQEKQFENEEYQLKLDALNKQIAALDRADKDYENKLRALYNRQEEMEREHQNKLSEIKDRATAQQNQHQLAAITQLEGMFAQGFASVIMRHESFAQMMSSIGDRVASGMIENAIMSMLTLDMTKEREAAAAARQAFLAGWHFPFPVNIAAAPAMGAAAFAAVMAFNEGGLVPGTGTRDTIPAMLTPGESVLPRSLTENLTRAAHGGGGGHHVTLHYRPSYQISTIDGDGIRGVLTEHAEEFHQHFQHTMRRMNH